MAPEAAQSRCHTGTSPSPHQSPLGSMVRHDRVGTLSCERCDRGRLGLCDGTGQLGPDPAWRCHRPTQRPPYAHVQIRGCNMAVRPRSKWRLRNDREGGFATLKMAAQTRPGWWCGHSQDGDWTTLNLAAGPLSRWRLHGGHKMARRGTFSPRKAPVLPPEADPASSFAA